MFDNFSNKITKVFSALSGKKTISESDLEATLREIRIVLLESDVSLAIAKEFIEKIKLAAVGQEVVKSVSASQMIIKIINDELVKLLGSERAEINLNVKSPAIILMAGLQGAGKTTSSGKIALRIKNKSRRKILLCSLDTYRPAAAKQLQILAEKISVSFADFDQAKSPLQLAKEAKQKAITEGYDILILDSAGRSQIDEEMMRELIEIKKEINPHETLLVADAMIGQDAVNVAKSFNEKLALDGIILTRLDGDSKGGAALTMKAATSCPIKFIGTGEKLEDFEEFNPDRIASRILGMGDVVSLVEKAQEVFDEEELKKVEKKFKSGKFDLNDLLSQMKNMKKMGGFASILKFLPGGSAITEHLDKLGVAEKDLKIQESLILSMTKKERERPDILNSSRKHRIAKGAGRTIQEVNSLLKKYKQMQKMMGKFGKIDPGQLQEMMRGKNMNGFR